MSFMVSCPSFPSNSCNQPQNCVVFDLSRSQENGNLSAAPLVMFCLERSEPVLDPLLLIVIGTGQKAQGAS